MAQEKPKTDRRLHLKDWTAAVQRFEDGAAEITIHHGGQELCLAISDEQRRLLAELLTAPMMK